MDSQHIGATALKTAGSGVNFPRFVFIIVSVLSSCANRTGSALTCPLPRAWCKKRPALQGRTSTYDHRPSRNPLGMPAHQTAQRPGFGWHQYKIRCRRRLQNSPILSRSIRSPEANCMELIVNKRVLLSTSANKASSGVSALCRSAWRNSTP